MLNIDLIKNKYFFGNSSSIPFFISRRISNIVHFILLGKLANGILHDMMSPLTSLLISLELKNTHQEREMSSNELREFIRVIQTQLRNESKKEKFLSSEVVKDACVLIRHKAIANNVRLVVLTEDDYYLFGNKITLIRSVINLINNAIESYDICPKKKQSVVISIYKDEYYINFSVKDFGCGIDENNKNKVCNFLYTKKENGTGLGLFITKKLIRKEYMGKLKIETTINKGSTFTIQIPLKTTL